MAMHDALKAIEIKIAEYEAVLSGLYMARSIIAGEPQASSERSVALLPAPADHKPAPARKPKKAKPKAERVPREALTYEIEGVDVRVTPAQRKIIALLSDAEDAIDKEMLAKKCGTTPGSLYQQIRDLIERIKRAGSKAEINHYAGRGYRLEIDRGE